MYLSTKGRHVILDLWFPSFYTQDEQNKRIYMIVLRVVLPYSRLIVNIQGGGGREAQRRGKSNLEGFMLKYMQERNAAGLPYPIESDSGSEGGHHLEDRV